MIVSQGIGRPEERERGGGMTSQWGSQDTHYIYRSSLLSHMGMVHGAPKQLQSVITDHHNRYNHYEKLKYCDNHQNVTQNHKVRNHCWKNCADCLVQLRVAVSLQL